MQAPTPPPGTQNPEGDLLQATIDENETETEPELTTPLSPGSTSQKENELKKLTGDLVEFTGNRVISWDQSVINVNDQTNIFKLGRYIANAKTLSESTTRKISEIIQKIREREGVILQEDLKNLAEIKDPAVKRTLGLISIFTNPTVLIYSCGAGKKDATTTPEWKVLGFKDTDKAYLDITNHKIEDLGRIDKRFRKMELKHSLVGISAYTSTGVKLRNGLIYSVGDSQLSRSTSSSILLRSLSPPPRPTTPQKNKRAQSVINTPKPIEQTPRFHVTPLKIGSELKNPEEVRTIQIHKLSTPEETPTISIVSQIEGNLVNIKECQEWHHTRINISEGLILHVKYKIENKNPNIQTPIMEPIVTTNTTIKEIHKEKVNNKKSKSPKKTKEKDSNTKQKQPKVQEKKVEPQPQQPKTNKEQPKEKPKEQEKDKSQISKSIQIYKSQPTTTLYDPLTTVKDSYRIDGNPPRNITAIMTKSFSNSFVIRKPSNAQYILLNLPSVILDSSSNVPLRGEENNQSVERKAQSSFIKGKYADAYSLIIDGETKATNPKYSQVEALFPSEEGGRNLSGSIPKASNAKMKFTVYEKDVSAAMSTMKNGRGCGPSGMSSEVLKKLWKTDAQIREKMTDMIKHFITEPQDIDKNFFCSNLTCIPKSNGGIRPIAVEECFMKLVNKVVCSRLIEQTLKKIHPNQFCIQNEDSQMKAVELVKRKIDAGYVNIISVDFKNAYGTINRTKMIQQMKDFEVDNTLIRYIAHFLDNQKMLFTDNEGKQQTICPSRGIAQGDPTSSLLFCIGVNRLLVKYNSKHIQTIAYADDFVLMSKDINALSETWKTFRGDASELGLEINLEKTQLLLHDEPSETKQLKEQFKLEPKSYNSDYIWTYLDIPISMNLDLIKKHCKEKFTAYQNEVKKLWRAQIPLQTKYHLNQMCQVGRLSYYLKGLFHGTDITPNELARLDKTDRRTEEYLPTPLKDIPQMLRIIPYHLGGMNMTTLKDLATIIYITTKLRNGQKINGYEHLDISQEEARDYYKVRYKYYYAKVMAEPSMRNRTLHTEVYSLMTLTIQKPPNSPKQFLNDKEFTMLIDQLFELDHTNLGWGDCDMCLLHDGQHCNLSHVTKCHRVMLQSIRCHNAICSYIHYHLKRGGIVTKPELETYSTYQQNLRNNEERNKRADITYKIGETQHSIDVSLTGLEKSKDNRVDPLKRQYTYKIRCYQGEPNIHPIIFGINGTVYKDSWDYLTKLGFKLPNLKDIQRIILKYTTQKVEDTKILNNKTWRQRAKRQRRRNNSINRKNEQQTEKPGKQSLLTSYMTTENIQNAPEQQLSLKLLSKAVQTDSE